ncbi:MAG: hypothetical protein OT477_14785 [Chloroflexi bacterium]|nr:hypothetical protein [Chloroflexota bacterium]
MTFQERDPNPFPYAPPLKDFPQEELMFLLGELREARNALGLLGGIHTTAKILRGLVTRYEALLPDEDELL